MRQQYSSVCYMYYIILVYLYIYILVYILVYILIYFIKSTNFYLAYVILYNFMQNILISNVRSIDM